MEQTLEDGEGQRSLRFLGLQKVRHDLATEQQYVHLGPSQTEALFLGGEEASFFIQIHTIRKDSSYFYIQFSSVVQLCPTLCDPMDCNTPGLPVHHQLLEFTQTHVHRVSDAIQPSHPLSSPSPRAPNPSQHQSLFQ